MKPGNRENKTKKVNKKIEMEKDSGYNVKSLDMYKTSDTYQKRKAGHNKENKTHIKDTSSSQKPSYQRSSSYQNASYDNSNEEKESTIYEKKSYKKEYSSNIKQEPSEEKRRKKIKKKRIVYSKKTIALFLSISIVAVSAFSFLGLLMYRYSMVSDMKYELNTLNSTLSQIKNQKKELEVELETTNRSESIEQIAVDVLKMQYPSEEKIVYIKVD